jgi:thymidylate synthase (FAD)
MKLVNASTVDFVDKLGTDLTVVNAARVSFDKHSEYVTVGTEEVFDQTIDVMGMKLEDVKLLNYLGSHGHWSPFAHAQVQLRITAPIFVARQLVKHQIGLVWNEVSRRYVADEPTFFLPKVYRGAPINGAKQGSHGEVILPDYMLDRINVHLAESEALYNELMDAFGVAAEQARMFLPQNMMTSWYWTGSLYACARICHLRLDPHAQGESRDVAVEIDRICSEHFPNAWAALI